MDDITKAIIELLQDDEVLKEYVQEWNAQEGTKPGKKVAVSAGCYKCSFSEYDGAQDSMTAVYNIYVSLPADSNNIGLAVLLAENIRYALTENETLNGVVSASFVSGIQYQTTFQRDEAAGAVVFLEINKFVDRYRLRKTPTVAKIKLDSDYK